ncbi:50S ribosomal protein L13 [Candidatus Falkowbacteria bacterium]|nr:50S ribosomal protein L13 [Candidatus Falkowbacteria bacterium]
MSVSKIQRKTHKIDATGQAVGRIATQAATFLRGKNKASFVPYLDMGDNVVVENADKLKFSGKKLDQKVYYHHTGYPGGLKTTKMKDLKPEEIVKRAVWNMLPKNKLRDIMIKRLVIKR